MSAPAASRPVATVHRLGSARPITLSRFLPLVPEIVVEVLARIESDLPEFATAAWRSRGEDETFLMVELGRQLELCERGVGFEDADLLRFAAHFAGMARRGAPLPAVQRFCRSAIVDTFSELWARAEPGDVTELLRFSQWLSRNNGAMERLLVTIYSGQLDPGRQQADRREELAERLLAGLGEQASAESCDLAVAPAYLVVVLLGTEEPRIRDLPSGTLSAPVDRQYHLLVPVDSAAARPRVWNAVARWVTAQGGMRAAGAFATDPMRIPVAASAARRLVEAAAAIRLPASLVGEQEMALETALADHPHGLERVAAVLDLLDADRRLLVTLTTFFDLDLDRTRTAAALFLSRGGLSLRLDRVAALTGLDPRSTRGIQVLGAALSARALLDVRELHAG